MSLREDLTILCAWRKDMSVSDEKFVDVCQNIENRIKDVLHKFDEHRKSNDLWRLPIDESWSMAEDWIEELLK